MTSYHASNGPPLAWGSNRFNHCLSSVLPRIESPSYNRDVTRCSYKKSAISTRDSARLVNRHKSLQKIDSAKDILYQQRLSIKIFTGNRWPFNRSVQDITNRLSQYDSATRPADSKELFPPLEHTAPSTSGQKYSAQDVQDIVDRLSTYDPEKVPESKGYQLKFVMPIIYKKKYTKLEIEDIVDRLTDFDPDKFPAESKGINPVVLHEIPKHTLVRPRKCTAREVQELVDRLCEKDPRKWPESKRYRILDAFNTVMSGKPEGR